ncbi:MAG TPA: hypothetical protein VMH26_00310 [Burkholderiales bacterium]|nr:hypothetical protein [Burkholderiales bacterium]
MSSRIRLHRKPLLAAFAFATCLGVVTCGASADGGGRDSDLPQAAEGQLRRVWVLMDLAESTSEGGPTSSSTSPSIVPYEIRCASGQLRSAQRSMAAVGLYGVPVWTVRVRDPLSSQDGAEALRAALEDVCKV